MLRWLREGHRGLTCEAGQRLLHGGLVAVLEEQLADEVCVDADGAVVAWSIHGVGSEPARSARECSAAGIIDVT